MDVESNELSKLGAEALRDLYNNLAGVKQFALEQAPDVCQQMIRWEILLAVILGAALVAFTAAWAFTTWRWRNWKDGDGDSFALIPGVIGGFLTVILSVVFLVKSFIPAMQAYCAPKLFLLEKIAAMLKGLS